MLKPKAAAALEARDDTIKAAKRAQQLEEGNKQREEARIKDAGRKKRQRRSSARAIASHNQEVEFAQNNKRSRKHNMNSISDSQHQPGALRLASPHAPKQAQPTFTWVPTSRDAVD